MHLQLNECKTCGGVLHRVGNHYICQACGNKWTIDAAEDVHVVDRANAWAALRNGDFDHAAELFEIIRDNVVFDISRPFFDSLGGDSSSPIRVWRMQIENGNNTLASSSKMHLRAWDKALTSLRKDLSEGN